MNKTIVPKYKLDRSFVSLLKDINEHGGDSYLVGGYVRDLYLGIKNKDIDVEVFKLPVKKLELILNKYGKVDAVGKAFGVFKININGLDYDFSMPRREFKKGHGHKGFEVFGDCNMSTLEASSRRDFTINSIMLNPLTNKVIDHHNGLSDLKDGRLKYIAEAFKDDPLRPLRGMQFSSRFNLTSSKDTNVMCHSMLPMYNEISKERIWEEWKKWSLSNSPQNGIEFLNSSGWIENYPEISNLKGCVQSLEWHPEGDVFIHTNLCLEQAARMAVDRNYNERDRMILVFSILCHDFGKPETTNFIDGKIRALGHAEAGAKHAENFLNSIDAPKWLVQQVLPLVEKHLHHAGIKSPNKRNVRRLINSLSPATVELWDAVVEADKSGRYPLPKLKLDPLWLEIADKVKDEISEYDNKIKPILQGRDLINLGIKPSKEFGKMLDDTYEYQLESGVLNKEDLMIWFSDVYLKHKICNGFSPTF